MNARICLPALFCLGWMMLCPRTQAWDATGHMAVAGIAYDHLTPKTKAKVNALLARHKDYGKWMIALPAGYTNRARFAFMKAATWPDDIRKTPDDRPLWHYSDLPVIAPGYTPDPLELRPVKPNAETQIIAETKLLTDKAATDGDRAIALCWVEHLVGDVHQPLHAASLFSPLFPKGDRGGNSDLLRPGAVDGDTVERAAHPHNLHALWDDLLGTTKDPSQIDRIAVRLQAPAFAASTFPQMKTHPSVHDWLVESNALAKNAYRGGTLPLKADGDKADVTLPPDYLPKAHHVADRQVALAGLRLSALLNARTFPSVSSVPTPLTTPAAAQSPKGLTDAATGRIIGNKRSHVYHLPGAGGRLPAEKNRVYFQTESEAQSAGYHKGGA